jgi:hypothetical protein
MNTISTTHKLTSTHIVFSDGTQVAPAELTRVELVRVCEQEDANGDFDQLSHVELVDIVCEWMTLIHEARSNARPAS